MDYAKLATVLAVHSARVKKDDLVCIYFEPPAKEAAMAMFAEVIRRGAHAFFDPKLPEADEIFFEFAKAHQLDRVNDLALWYRSNVNCLIFFRSPVNTSYLGGIDPKTKQRKGVANSPLMAITDDRSTKGDLRWVLTEIASDSNSQNAGMGLRQFDKFVERAGMMHLKDPLGFWRRFSAWQQTVVNELNRGHTIGRVISQRADLTLEVGHSTWINCDGRINFPDGEVYTGPGSVNGWIKPLPFSYNGEVVLGASLRIENGRVIEATAEMGQDFLLSLLSTDEGASGIGEWGIGTNPNVTKPVMSTLLDEKMCKTIHLAIGNGYQISGSTNRSAIHCDMIVPMGDDGVITLDDQPIYENGEFTIGDSSLKPAFV